MTMNEFLTDMLDSEERTVRVVEANLRGYVQNTDKLIAKHKHLNAKYLNALSRIQTLEIAYQVLKEAQPMIVHLDIKG